MQQWSNRYKEWSFSSSSGILGTHLNLVSSGKVRMEWRLCLFHFPKYIDSLRASEGCIQFLFFFVLLDILCIKISNVIPFPSFLSGTPSPIPPSPASMRMLPLPPTQPLPPHCPSIPLHWELSLHKTKDLSSYWCQTMPSSATYAARAMGLSMCTLWFVVWELWGLWLVDIVVLPVSLQTPSAPSVLSPTPTSETLC